MSIFSAIPFEKITNQTIRFYANWFIQFATTSGCFIAVVASMSFYIGVCSYMEAMINDMEQRLKDSDTIVKDASINGSAVVNIQPIYVEEIQFHSDILE